MEKKTEQNQNQNKETEQKEVQQQTQQETPVAPQAQPEQKGGFGNWFKKHWKGVLGTVTGALAVGGSAVVAYKKGKAAGTMQPVQTEDDNSLNPNI